MIRICLSYVECAVHRSCVLCDGQPYVITVDSYIVYLTVESYIVYVPPMICTTQHNTLIWCDYVVTMVNDYGVTMVWS